MSSDGADVIESNTCTELISFDITAKTLTSKIRMSYASVSKDAANLFHLVKFLRKLSLLGNSEHVSGFFHHE